MLEYNVEGNLHEPVGKASGGSFSMQLGFSSGFKWE